MLVPLRALAAAALLLRLAGVAREHLPSTAFLVFLLVALHVAGILARWPRSRSWRELASANAFALGLVAVCALAALMRLPGFASDLGHTPLDIDEHRFAASVKHYFVTGELLHSTVEHYPGAVFWLFSAASFLSFLRGLTSGVTTPISALPVDRFVEAARFTNICVAVATVAITGLIGRRLSGSVAGLLSAALVAVAPLSVDVTVLARNDPGMTLAVCAATLTSLVYYDTGTRPWIIAAGALAGVAGAIKYSAVFAFVPVAIAVLAGTPRQQRVRLFLSTIAAFIVAVAVTNHFMWADFPNFLRQLSDQVAITGSGHWNATANPARFYLGTLAGLGPGWPIVLLAGGFIAYALATRDPRLWIVVSFPLLYIWFMTQRPSQFARWVYPMLPYVAVAGAAALATLTRVLHAALASRLHPRRRLAEAVVAATILAVLAQPAWAAAVSFSRRVTTPTHALVEAWIRQNAAAGSAVLLGRGWLDVRGARFTAQRVANLRATLDAGIEQVAGCDFVIVPEPVFGHSTLRHLMLAERFQARYSFGGNLGMDYEVYSVPDIPIEGVCGKPQPR